MAPRSYEREPWLYGVPVFRFPNVYRADLIQAIGEGFGEVLGHVLNDYQTGAILRHCLEKNSNGIRPSRRCAHRYNLRCIRYLFDHYHFWRREYLIRRELGFRLSIRFRYACLGWRQRLTISRSKTSNRGGLYRIMDTRFKLLLLLGRCRFRLRNGNYMPKCRKRLTRLVILGAIMGRRNVDGEGYGKERARKSGSKRDCAARAVSAVP